MPAELRYALISLELRNSGNAPFSFCEFFRFFCCKAKIAAQEFICSPILDLHLSISSNRLILSYGSKHPVKHVHQPAAMNSSKDYFNLRISRTGFPLRKQEFFNFLCISFRQFSKQFFEIHKRRDTMILSNGSQGVDDCRPPRRTM